MECEPSVRVDRPHLHSIIYALLSLISRLLTSGSISCCQWGDASSLSNNLKSQMRWTSRRVFPDDAGWESANRRLERCPFLRMFGMLRQRAASMSISSSSCENREQQERSRVVHGVEQQRVAHCRRHVPAGLLRSTTRQRHSALLIATLTGYTVFILKYKRNNGVAIDFEQDAYGTEKMKTYLNHT